MFSESEVTAGCDFFSFPALGCPQCMCSPSTSSVGVSVTERLGRGYWGALSP